MKVLIVGLGLMGGAYAYRLSNKGYTVYGSDINMDSIDYALEKKYISIGYVHPEEFIMESDLIVLAIYPKALVSFVERYKEYFHEGQVITDICGVKSDFIYEATKLSKPATYCSHHPMAGREKIGIAYSTECVFGGANYLITPTKDTKEEAIELLKQIGTDLGFKRISVMDIEKHNRMIGFTSQLTHAIAVSLVNSDNDSDTKNYIGDSYRDLTRIAMINENLWSELFLEN
jgi:prephenate dehydrogenase